MPETGLDAMATTMAAGQRLFELWLGQNRKHQARMIEQAFRIDTPHGRIVSARFLILVEKHHAARRAREAEVHRKWPWAR